MAALEEREEEEKGREKQGIPEMMPDSEERYGRAFRTQPDAATCGLLVQMITCQCGKFGDLGGRRGKRGAA
jgi:hypothetical protein